MGILAEVGSYVLLFSLVFGMSATVDIGNLKKQLSNKNALLTGIFLQFVALPFLGFAVVKALGMNSAMGITLLVVTSSPGGSYSNWWCSMFNADLALSVTMTAISTLMSIIMLPINLVIYATSSYSSSVVTSLDWTSLFASLIVVISAIFLGLCCSAKINSHKFNLFANKLGNIAGIALVVFSILVSSSSDDTKVQMWGRDWEFYLGVASPCVFGLLIANLMTSFFRLKKPERVTVSVECCYQNVGIATSVAITMFDGEELGQAIGVPLFYGLVEAIVLGFYCIIAWKFGWTKAPKDESVCVIISTSYEVEEAEMHDLNAIEVILGIPKDNLPNDLVFQMGIGNGSGEVTAGDDGSGSLYAVSYPPTPDRESLRNKESNLMGEEMTNPTPVPTFLPTIMSEGSKSSLDKNDVHSSPFMIEGDLRCSSSVFASDEKDLCDNDSRRDLASDFDKISSLNMPLHVKQGLKPASPRSIDKHLNQDIAADGVRKLCISVKKSDLKGKEVVMSDSRNPLNTNGNDDDGISNCENIDNSFSQMEDNSTTSFHQSKKLEPSCSKTELTQDESIVKSIHDSPSSRLSSFAEKIETCRIEPGNDN